MITLLLSAALAATPWWARTPDPDVPGAVDLPLLRSPEEPRPRVLAAVGERRLLALIDLGGGPTRVGWGAVYGAELKPRKVRTRDGIETRVRIPEIVLGDVVLRDVRALVDGSVELVLGVGAIEGLEVAILPSEGRVRLAPPGSGLVDARGEPVPISTRPVRRWWESGVLRSGLGKGVAAFVEVGEERRQFGVRTDVLSTALVNGVKGERVQVDLAGGVWVDARVDDRYRDPRPDWGGVIGADVWAHLDMASDGSQIAWTAAVDPHWSDPDDLAVALEVLDDRRATALWRAGRVDEALEASLSAAENGDCLAWTVLGMRRLRAGEDGALDALEVGMGQWQAWASLDPETRDLVREGRPTEVDSAVQPAICAQITGRWLLARLGHGEDPIRVAEDAVAYDDPLDWWTPMAGGIAYLRAGQPGDAEPLLRTALQRGGGDEVRVALAGALMAQGDQRQSGELLRSTDGRSLLVAWTAVRLGLAPTDDDPARRGFAARQAVWTGIGIPVDPTVVGEALEQARISTAGAAWTDAAQRLLRQPEDDGKPPHPRWAARSPDRWIPWLMHPDPDVRELGQAVLAARFPEWYVPPPVTLPGKRETPGGVDGLPGTPEDTP